MWLPVGSAHSAAPAARLAFSSDSQFCAFCPPTTNVASAAGAIAAIAAAWAAVGGGGGGARRRSLPGTVATAPLAVGRQKGLAAVLVGQKRIVLLDLEEDECDEDE